MQQRPKFDVTEVIRMLRQKRFEDAAEIHHEFTSAMRDNPTLKIFAAEICEETYAIGCQPVQAMQCALVMGMRLGVLLERQRRKII